MRADCSWELPKDAGYDGEPLIVTLATSLVGFCACIRVVTTRLNIICMVGEFLTVLFFINSLEQIVFLLFT